ncbi:hypothetical protein SDC9_211538 [bioreactor metagenome]|uniref:Uncharacterized protein n=1 Tax=bioreactor metagenome TaxID=1076179 RepID=A0A645JKJ8_9ZZZZ
MDALLGSKPGMGRPALYGCRKGDKSGRRICRLAYVTAQIQHISLLCVELAVVCDGRAKAVALLRYRKQKLY